MALQLIIHALFASSLVIAVLSFFGMRGNKNAYSLAEKLFYGLAGGIVVSFISLSILIFYHSFDHTYVWSYSSRSLQPWFLFASTYSGQEGSFLLWSMWIALIGLFVIRYAKKRQWHNEVIFVYALLLVFLTALLVAKNPFSLISQSFAKDGVTAFSPTPLDGRGLNPVLHNVWITIHPPILFTGFAAMTVPFAFAFAALIRKEWDKWIEIALPWTLFASGILGFGIMLGGFWAYETLGWGGFWGWDPVENSSLIPWLVSVSLVHTLLVQRKTGGLMRTNIVLSMLTFLLVLYSTFLTRSGILGDTSVHSFVDPGMTAYVLLLIFMGTFVIIGGVMLALRFKSMPRPDKLFAGSSRELFTTLGSGLILASAILVTLGTSYPIYLEITGQPKVAIETSFYNQTHLPLTIVFLLANVVALSLRWKKSNWRDALRELMWPGLASGVFCVAIAINGMPDWKFLVLAFAGWFSLLMNVTWIVKVGRKSITNAGAYLGHVGISLLVLGVFYLSQYGSSQTLTLPQGEKVHAFGKTFEFTGRTQIETELKDREKYEYNVFVDGGYQDTLKPILYKHDFNKRASYYLEPSIHAGISHDLYISPQGLDTKGEYKRLTLSKEIKYDIPFGSNLQVTLHSFDMSGAIAAQQTGGDMKMGAVMTFIANGIEETTTLYSLFDGENFAPSFVQLKGTSVFVGLTKITRNNAEPNKSTAEVSFYDTTIPSSVPREVFVCEVSVKPFIWLVWAGVIIMAFGFFASIGKYTSTKKKQSNVL